MGVRGLTTYIAQNAKQFLQRYELHDCNVVIDGDNIASMLHQCNSAFGGDYDTYYRKVIEFFEILIHCGITPYVLMDGGYERKKMRRIKDRLQAKICVIKHINPLAGSKTYPLMLREVFVDAARACNVSVMRCVHESDDEVAILARRLNCPLLSYDSDFYIHNVKFIPFSTVLLKIQTKRKRKGQETDEDKHYYYIDCFMYSMKKLGGRAVLSKEMMPILATMLGNDYIERKLFRQFFANVKLRGTSKRSSLQQRRIAAMFQWLQHETVESATRKVLLSAKESVRQQLEYRMKVAMQGYQRNDSKAFDFFGFEEVYEEESGNEDEEVDEDGEEEGAYEEEEEQEEEKECSEVEEDEEKEYTNEQQSESDEDVSSSSNGSEDETSELNIEEEGEPEASNDNDEESDTVSDFPEWFLERYSNAEMPRFFVDLLHLKYYINYPQVENFKAADSNSIAKSILLHIHALLNAPHMPQLKYFSRVANQAIIESSMLECPNVSHITFDPYKMKNTSVFRMAFDSFLDADKIFEAVKELPASFQLYFLAIAFWSRKSMMARPNMIAYLHSLILCAITLKVVDRKAGVVRSDEQYQRIHKRTLPKLKKHLQETAADNTEPEQPLPLPQALKKIPKNECVLLQESLIPLFGVSDRLRARHSEYSSSVVHVFAEFQAVVFNLNALNVLTQNPFVPIRMADFFNGLFVYNIFEKLKSRQDINVYVQQYLFKNTKRLCSFYAGLSEWCSRWLGPVSAPHKSKKISKGNRGVAPGSQELNEQIELVGQKLLDVLSIGKV